MAKIFKNSKSLKMDMEEKGRWIDSFLFRYKQQDFVVLVKLYEDDEVKPDYALLKIEFFKASRF